MDEKAVFDIIKQYYDIKFDRIEFIRESGCFAYALYSGTERYFLRVTKPMFKDTAFQSLNIHLYLQKSGFSVPQIIPAINSEPYFCISDAYYVIYEYIDGHEVDPEKDAEAIGSFIGELHRIMRNYPGKLPVCGKQFYIGRYIDILHKKAYPNADKFAEYGEILWKRIKSLPTGPCHGDMYRGNILQTADGRMYLLDFDTFCIGFPMYDPALICCVADYFNYSDDGLEKTLGIYHRFLPYYTSRNPVTQPEIDCLCNLIALYHFSLQATIIEIFGLDCVDNEFLDNQLNWLMKWEAQCSEAGTI